MAEGLVLVGIGTVLGLGGASWLLIRLLTALIPAEICSATCLR